MRVNNQKRQQAGLANYHKRLEAVGIEHIKEVGRESAKRRKVFGGGCTNREFASTIGKRGGALSRRSRKITLETELKPDEWFKLRQDAVTVAGTLRMEGKVDPIVWSKLKNLDLQLAQERQDWVWVMNNALPNENWHSRLGIFLCSQRDFFKHYLLAHETLSEAQKNEFRIIRNLIAAWKVAGENNNAKETEGEAKA